MTSMYRYFAEALGSFILVLLGDSGIASAVFAQGATGFIIVPLGWGIGTLVAIYAVGGISGGHFHPGITVAAALTKRMNRKDVFPYIVFQVIGAYLGGAAVFATRFGNFNLMDPLREKITSANILFAQYPNALFWPDYHTAAVGGTGALVSQVDAVFPAWMGILAELLLGGIGLMLLVAAVLDSNSPLSSLSLAPLIIGIYIVAAVSILGPLTTAGITPIRDFGPRLFAWTIGYGNLAFPGARGFEWSIYWVGPVIGAVLGILLYDYALKPYYLKLKAPKHGVQVEAEQVVTK